MYGIKVFVFRAPLWLSFNRNNMVGYDPFDGYYYSHTTEDRCLFSTYKEALTFITKMYSEVPRHRYVIVKLKD